VRIRPAPLDQAFGIEGGGRYGDGRLWIVGSDRHRHQALLVERHAHHGQPEVGDLHRGGEGRPSLGESPLGRLHLYARGTDPWGSRQVQDDRLDAAGVQVAGQAI
jgi:hypothetical protein